MASTQVNLYEAKTQLSSLVERAAKGEEIIIAKAGRPLARLSAFQEAAPAVEPKALPFGENLLGITFLAADWEDDVPLEMFEDPEGDKLLFSGHSK
jgi:antitoxin (DNA-binding transcriptional repressor) of toxin-antitoxin stability system